MKHFFTKLIVVIPCFYGILFLMQSLVDFGLQHTYDDMYNDWNLIFEGKIKEPMVFLGSSRAEAHFDPIIIERNTGIPSYNLGMPAASLKYQKVKWKSYLAHNHPQIVIQNIDLHALLGKGQPSKRFYIPYYHDSALYQELQKLDKTVRLEKWIPMSKYRDNEALVYKGILGCFGKKYRLKKIKGHHKHHESWNTDFDLYKKSLKGKPVDYSDAHFSEGFKELKELIADCKKRNVTLILVWTPAYYELSALQNPTFLNVKAAVTKMAYENNIAFWDFSNGDFNRNKKFFYNSYHMNAEGVSVFCNQFSDSLNTYLRHPNT